MATPTSALPPPAVMAMTAPTCGRACFLLLLCGVEVWGEGVGARARACRSVRVGSEVRSLGCRCGELPLTEAAGDRNEAAADEGRRVAPRRDLLGAQLVGPAHLAGGNVTVLNGNG